MFLKIKCHVRFFKRQETKHNHHGFKFSKNLIKRNVLGFQSGRIQKPNIINDFFFSKTY